MPSHAEFLEQVCQGTPPSKVRTAIQKAIELPKGASVKTAAATLGNGSEVTAQDTVPFVLWTAACHLGNYEEALWATVAGLGDRDTTCAIVGGIVVMNTGLENIPKRWLEHREPISRSLPPKAMPLAGGAERSGIVRCPSCGGGTNESRMF